MRRLAFVMALATLACLTAPTAALAAATAFDEDPATTERIAQTDPTAAAVDVSRARFADADSGGGDGPQARFAVLSRDDDFADSLAGAPLSAGGPLLLTNRAALSEITELEIDRVLPAGGLVYLLGGTVAIEQAVEDRLVDLGYQVVRREGPSRVETSIQVAAEVESYTGSEQIAVARAFGAPGNPTSAWADSVTGGAFAALYGIPIVVTPTEGLHPAVEEYLAFYSPTTTILFGGTAALSEDVERSVPNPHRIFGPERAATAAEIYRASGPEPNTPGRFVIINGFVENGWAFGLPAGGLAADNGAGLLLVGEDVPAPTAELVSACGAPEVEMLVVGSEAVVSQPVFDELDRLDGEAC